MGVPLATPETMATAGKEIARKKLNQNEMPLGGGLAWDSTLWRRSLISRRSSVQLG